MFGQIENMIVDTFINCLNWLHAFWDKLTIEPYFFLAFGMILLCGKLLSPALGGRSVGSDKARYKEEE